MARQAELRRRDLQLLRAERQRRLCEDIISTQRKIIEGIRMTNLANKFSCLLFSPQIETYLEENEFVERFKDYDGLINLN